MHKPAANSGETVMKNSLHAVLIAVAGATLVTAATTSVHALDVSQVQLGVVDLGGSACPRDAKVTAWAHTDGPGVVKFVIRNDSGGETGELSVNAVKGPAGNYLATYSRTFKIQTDTDIKYMAEAVGHGKISPWVNFAAKCGPQPRKTTTTTSGEKPKGKHVSEINEPSPKKTTKTTSGDKPKGKHVSEVDQDDEPKGKPTQNAGKPAGKPIPDSKPIAQCKPTVTVTRGLAATRAGGLATAQAAWQATSAAWYGASYGRWSNADDQSSSCVRKTLTFECTVSARPCES
jgi:hypothetical protein